MNLQFAQSRLLWKHDRLAHTQVEIMRRMINRKHGLNLGKRELGIAIEVHLPIWPVGRNGSGLPRSSQVLRGELHILVGPLGVPRYRFLCTA
jgi:hypothetical protein